MSPIKNREVASVFDRFPTPARTRLLELRALIYDVAASTQGVGPIEEALRWGEPAYLTSKSKSGSTIRLGWKDSVPGTIALHFICNTNLVERFRNWYPKALRFEGNRSIVLEVDDPLPVEPLKDCIAAALTYHLDKRKRPRTVR